MYICTHTHRCTLTHTYCIHNPKYMYRIPTHKHKHLYTCTPTLTNTVRAVIHMHVYVDTRTYTCIHIYMDTHVYTKHIPTHVCTSIWCERRYEYIHVRALLNLRLSVIDKSTWHCTLTTFLRACVNAFNCAVWGPERVIRSLSFFTSGSRPDKLKKYRRTASSWKWHSFESTPGCSWEMCSSLSFLRLHHSAPF